MNSNLRDKTSTVLIVSTVLLAGIGVQGILDLRVLPYWGFSLVDDRVSRVVSGSPADRAGFQVGDKVVLDGGIAARDLKALNQRPWPKQGDNRVYVLRRGDRSIQTTLTFSRMPQADIQLYLAKAVVGVLAVIAGLLVYLKTGGQPGALLALMSDSVGAAMISEPYLSTVFWERLWMVFQFCWIVPGLAFLCHFTRVFPPERSERGGIVAIIYAPVILIGLILLPYLYSGVRLPRTLIVLTVIVTIGYLGVSAVTLVRNYFGCAKNTRRALGLNVMMLGTVAGLLPLLLPFLVILIVPGVRIPGMQYVPFSMALILASFVFACLKAHSVTRIEPRDG